MLLSGMRGIEPDPSGTKPVFELLSLNRKAANFVFEPAVFELGLPESLVNQRESTCCTIDQDEDVLTYLVQIGTA